MPFIVQLVVALAALTSVLAWLDQRTRGPRDARPTPPVSPRSD